MDRLALAKRLVASGLSIIPIRNDGTKAPSVKWKEYQSSIANPDTLIKWFEPKSRNGIAIVTGSVSGNLEVIDFDDLPSYNLWVELVQQQGQGALLDRLPVVGTPSIGRHIPYRCQEGIEGNQKLAQQRLRDGSLKILIETRGEGGYILTVGCPPKCHPLNKTYDLIQGDLSSIPEISREERHFLLQAARALNEDLHTDKEKIPGYSHEHGRPGDTFNNQASWNEILLHHDWVKVYQKGETTFWRRPRKSGPGISATTNHHGLDLLYVFSTKAAPFSAETAYTKFTAYTLLNYNGDFSAAVASLGVNHGSGNRAQRDFGEEPYWFKRSDLPLLLPIAPALPPELIPEPFRPWINDIEERMSVPLEAVAVAGIAGLSCIVGRQIGIKPKLNDDWLVIPNSWGMDVDRPGMLKTSREKAALKPVRWLAERAKKEFEKLEPLLTAQKEVHEAKIKNVKENIKKAIQKGDKPLSSL
jgi:hypothetical protein